MSTETEKRILAAARRWFRRSYPYWPDINLVVLEEDQFLMRACAADAKARKKRK